MLHGHFKSNIIVPSFKKKYSNKVVNLVSAAVKIYPPLVPNPSKYPFIISFSPFPFSLNHHLFPSLSHLIIMTIPSLFYEVNDLSFCHLQLFWQNFFLSNLKSLYFEFLRVNILSLNFRFRRISVFIIFCVFYLILINNIYKICYYTLYILIFLYFELYTFKSEAFL